MQFIKFKYYLKYLFAIVNIKVHHLERVEDLDVKFFLFILQQSFGVFNQPAKECRLENVFRSIKNIDNDGRLGLNNRMKLGF